jgi:hypothetical protein
MNQTAFAEIIESSLHSFVAQSWQWNTFPPFGSFVAVKNGLSTIYAVVHQVQTGSMDPQRTPFTYQKTEEELLAEQPQIFAFLKTTFTCTILGYSHKGAINYTISPEPAKIHFYITTHTCIPFSALHNRSATSTNFYWPSSNNTNILIF